MAINVTSDGRYTTKYMLSLGAKMVRGQMVVHDLSGNQNQDGGIFYRFDKHGRKWKWNGLGRARYDYSSVIAFGLDMPALDAAELARLEAIDQDALPSHEADTVRYQLGKIKENIAKAAEYAAVLERVRAKDAAEAQLA